MTNTLNIASNDDTIFFSINRQDINVEIIEKVHQILNEEYRRRILVPYISAEEQAELENILDAMTDDEREIVRTDVIKIKL